MLQNEIWEPIETPEMGAGSLEAKDEREIEEILQRACEIHRQHGGMFGYDFEDWVQAWREIPDRTRQTESGPADEMDLGLMADDRRDDRREVSEPNPPEVYLQLVAHSTVETARNIRRYRLGDQSSLLANTDQVTRSVERKFSSARSEAVAQEP